MAIISLFSPSSGAGDYSTRSAAISRQKKLADALAKIAEQETPVSTVGGITAPVSPMGALARGLTSFGGSYLARKASEEEAALKKAGSEELVKAISQFGKPYKTVDEAAPTVMEPGGEPIQQYTMRTPDSGEMMGEAARVMGLGVPGSEAIGAKLYSTASDAAERETAYNRLKPLIDQIPDEQARTYFDIAAKADPQNAAAAFGDAGVALMTPRRTATKNPFSAIGPDGKPGMFVMGEDGVPAQVPNMAPYNAPGTSVRIDMPKPDSAFSATFGAKAAEDAMQTIKLGRAAPGMIDSADRVIKVLTDPKIVPITGTFAETKLAVSKALYGDTPEAAATENLIADLARSTLDAIPSSGLGGGQGFTERDKQFLIDASAGRIQQTKENLLRMAKLRKTVGEANIRNANRVMKQVSGMPGYENMSGLLQSIPESARTAQSTRDAAAVDWARKNPKDPRSAAILKFNEAP